MTQVLTRLCFFFFVAAPFAAHGQQLGTKKDIVTETKSASGPIVQPMDLIQMVVALAIVAGLVKWVLPKVIGRLGRRISTPVGSTISLEESATFGGGQLQIVSVRGRTLLLCVATSGVTCLADLSEPPSTRQPEEPVFFDILDQADPTKAIVTTAPEEDEATEGMSMDDAMALIAAAQSRIEAPVTESPLDRLNRLTGRQ